MPKRTILLIILILAIVGGMVWFMRREPAVKAPSSESVSDAGKPVQQLPEAEALPEPEQEEVGQPAQGESEALAELPSAFKWVNPYEWNLTLRAEGLIASLGTGQAIGFGIVSDIKNPDVVYFATSSVEQGKPSNFISIYSFNIKTFGFDRLFRKAYESGDFKLGYITKPIVPVFHVVGLLSGEQGESDKLLILAQDVDDWRVAEHYSQ